MKNNYDILGIKCDASKEKIKSVYKKLSRIYHPDMPDTGNEEIFIKINNAFQEIEKNNFECNFYSSEKADYKKHDNEYNEKTKNQDFYRDATSGIVLGVFDGIFHLIKNIFRVQIFNRIFNLFFTIISLFFVSAKFLWGTVVRFFGRYGWGVVVLIAVWPLGIILLFYELFRVDDPIEKKTTKQKTRFFDILIVVTIIAILAGILFVAVNPKEKTIAENNSYKLENKKQEIIFNQPVKQVLKNGWYRKNYNGMGVAPISIKTKGDGYYFVKVVDAYTEKLIKKIFIHGGKSMSTKLPLGDYKIKYAYGKVWYGEKYLFGPDTQYSEADEIFNFEWTPEGYLGYTIELYLQINGNLTTKKINKEDF